jgi:putative alpha-1,2-mannosidase
LNNGKVFTIVAKDQGPKNTYVQRVKLNGTLLDRTYITHPEIMAGATVEFEMGTEPPER